MRLSLSLLPLLHTLTTFYLILDITIANPRLNHDQRWGDEVTGEGDAVSHTSSLDEQNQSEYKRRLLKYVFRTPEPSSELLDRSRRDLPYVMSKIYDTVADRETGTEVMPLDVDLIRGIPDDIGSLNQMQFWFNTTVVNTTEQVIDAFFHIYKRRAIRPPGVAQGSHRVWVKLYHIRDESVLYNSDNTIGPGAALIEQQQVSAYASEWIIFKGLKDIVNGWIQNRTSNQGFLVTATDPDMNHVNGTHIDFVQKGENPRNREPMFVVYTDQEEKRSNRIKRKQRSSIDLLVNNFLNEDVRRAQRLEEQCRMEADSEGGLTEECTMVARSRRSRSLPENIDDDDDEEDEDEDEYDDAWEDNAGRGRRRSRNRNQDPRELEAERRTNGFCQLRPLYIEFEALGWQRWIVAPPGINANQCDGECAYPLTNSLTSNNHAVLQSIANHHDPARVKKPCCVPRKLQNLSILYYQTETVVAMKTYDNIIVENCGCR